MYCGHSSWFYFIPACLLSSKRFMNFYSFNEIATSKCKSLMKFPVLLTTDLRLLAYFVTFMKRTKNAKLFESQVGVCECSDPPVALCPFGMSPRQCFAFTEGSSDNCFSPISPFACSHKLRKRIAFLYLK